MLSQPDKQKAASEIETLAAVIRDNPEPISRINPRVPLPFQWAVERCLAKNASDRYCSIRDLLNDLSSIVAGVTQVCAIAGNAHNLPAQRTTLIGREQELARTIELALQPDVRLVTLTGPGGIGKTRLAIELGRQLLQHFPGGVYFIPLERISNPELVTSEIASGLNLRRTADWTPSALKEDLRESFAAPTLLLLDNFEHVLSAGPLITDLLAASERLKVVVTSRTTLRLYGEHEFAVPPLAMPHIQAATETSALAESPAVSLFLQRAGAASSHGPEPRCEAPDGEDIRAVAEICSRLDCLPLSIELAAARTKVLPVHLILDRMRDRLQLLTGGPRDLPMRQQTLRATLDWSHNLLDADQQKLFRRLSVFVGGATVEGIEAVCNVRDDLGPDLLDTITSLVDNSLLRQIPSEAAELRFAMLETMRDYGLSRLMDAGEEAFTRRTHAAYFLVLAEEGRTQLLGAQQAVWFPRLDSEIGNFRAALDWLAASGEAEWGMRLAGALGTYWGLRGFAMEGRERLLTLLSLPAAAPRTMLRAYL